MSETPQEPMSLDAVHKAAVSQVARALMQPPYLLDPEPAKRYAAGAAGCIVVMPDRTVRGLNPVTKKFFDVHDTANPLAELTAWLASGAADSERVEAVELRKENIQKMTEEKARSGWYAM
ncbi:MAG: hypothetical protein ACREOQ_17680 [Gemmatimonadales bacterium]